jgi:ribose transport system ATP-binding protein
MEQYILEMKEITKTFPGVVALNNISFQVRPGEVHALVGENGAGKSTLMKVLNGAFQANSGEIRIDGQKVVIGGVSDAQALGISIIYQEFNLVNTLSVAENIFIGRYTGDGLINWRTLCEKAKALLENLGFPLDVKQTVGRLSTAEKQLVEIAKAISYNAKIIVMDEPTSSITKKEVEMLFRIIEKLKSDNRTVVFISHKLEEVFRICDTVTIMRDGQMVGSGPVKEMTREMIIEYMVGRSIDVEYPKRSVTPGETVLKVERLSRAPLLHNISFELRRGEILGLAGLVGAGRTELAETIFGAARADSGTIMVKGKKARIWSTRDGIKSSIGLLTEDRKETGLVLDFNMMNNISITNLTGIKKTGILSRKREMGVADQYRKMLNIKTPSVTQNVNNLSGGNQQKVVFGKWLFANVDILILDEPTRGIDVGAKFEIYCLMNELVAQGKSIIMISSELPEVIGMSDRILVLHNGRLKGELKGEQATAENVMQLAVN